MSMRGKYTGSPMEAKFVQKTRREKGIETVRGVRKRHGCRELVMYMSPHTT